MASGTLRQIHVPYGYIKGDDGNLVMAESAAITNNAATPAAVDITVGAVSFLKSALNTSNEYIVWLEMEPKLKICVCKKDIRHHISDQLFPEDATTILTSATISDKPKESSVGAAVVNGKRAMSDQFSKMKNMWEIRFCRSPILKTA